VRANETLAVPRRVLVRDSALVDHSVTLQTTLRVLLFVARHADYFLVTWYETLASDWLRANFAAEALLVPLLPFILKLLHASLEKSAAAVTAGGKVVVVTVSTVQSVVLVSERMID